MLIALGDACDRPKSRKSGFCVLKAEALRGRECLSRCKHHGQGWEGFATCFLAGSPEGTAYGFTVFHHRQLAKYSLVPKQHTQCKPQVRMEGIIEKDELSQQGSPLPEGCVLSSFSLPPASSSTAQQIWCC